MQPAANPVIVTSRSVLEEIVENALQRLLQRAEEEREEAVKGGRLGWVSNPEAMRLLGKTKGTLARWRKEEKIPYSKVGQSVYYKLADIEALLESSAA